MARRPRFAKLSRIEGLEAARRKFRGIPADAQREIAKALSKGADEVAQQARRFVPVDEGDLKENIKWTVRDSTRGLQAIITAGSTKDTAQAAYRSEFGRKASGDGHPGHIKQPFLFPAYWTIRRRVRSRIKRAIKAAVKAARNA